MPDAVPFAAPNGEAAGPSASSDRSTVAEDAGRVPVELIGRAPKAWEFVQQEICRRRSAVAAALVGEEAVEIIEEGRPETNEAFRHQR